jgi:hypothetical protein
MMPELDWGDDEKTLVRDSPLEEQEALARGAVGLERSSRTSTVRPARDFDRHKTVDMEPPPELKALARAAAIPDPAPTLPMAVTSEPGAAGLDGVSSDTRARIDEEYPVWDDDTLDTHVRALLEDASPEERAILEKALRAGAAASSPRIHDESGVHRASEAPGSDAASGAQAKPPTKSSRKRAPKIDRPKIDRHRELDVRRTQMGMPTPDMRAVLIGDELVDLEGPPSLEQLGIGDIGLEEAKRPRAKIEEALPTPRPAALAHGDAIRVAAIIPVCEDSKPAHAAPAREIRGPRTPVQARKPEGARATPKTIVAKTLESEVPPAPETIAGGHDAGHLVTGHPVPGHLVNGPLASHDSGAPPAGSVPPPTTPVLFSGSFRPTPPLAVATLAESEVAAAAAAEAARGPMWDATVNAEHDISWQALAVADAIRQRSRRRTTVAAVVSVVVVVAAAVALLAALYMPRGGTLRVELAAIDGAPVTSAQVFVDGTQRCSSAPCELDGLAAGAHDVRVVAAGFQTLERVVMVDRTQEKRVPLLLSRLP